jgi:hypothetical protein
MCNFSIPAKGPRIVRREKPKLQLKRHNYRERALPHLRKDFKDRCAYSMQHVDFAGGIEQMEVDHFDSTKKKDYLQQYENLFLAKGSCNRKKQDRPRLDEAKIGLRFLNCCKEADYNDVIFEDPKTHEVWGTTPVAIYHIRYLGLNSANLVRERKERFELSTIMRNKLMVFKRPPDAELAHLLQAMVKILDRHIPMIEMRARP